MYQSFKEISLKIFGGLGVLLMMSGGLMNIEEYTCLEMDHLRLDFDDWRLNIDDWRPEMIDLRLDMVDWSTKTDYLSPEPEIEDLDWQIDDLNWDFEMGLEIPFIAELDDLNCDIPEGKGSAWGKGWTEPSYPFDGEEDGLNTEYGFELGELFSENPLNSIEANIRQNKLAHLSNSQFGYDILDIDTDRYIITNQAIFEAEWLQMIRDLAVDIKVETISGNTVTTLTIDTEVANLLFTGDLLPGGSLFTGDLLSSGDSLLPGILESSEGSQLDYENNIRAIRDETVVLHSPEFREMFESINGSRALTILDVSPTSSSEVLSSTSLSPSKVLKDTMENMKELEWTNRMIVDWRERISILFSNQNPYYQPMPSWTHVPTKPSEPWAIEQWERDNEIRSVWAHRLNSGYNQINIVTNGLTDDYYSTNWFDEGYQDPQDLLGSHDIFEEEDLGLDRLFEYD